MNILLFFSQREARQMISFALESKLPKTTIYEADSPETAVAMLKKLSNIELIICETDKKGNPFVSFLATSKESRPCIVSMIGSGEAPVKDIKRVLKVTSLATIVEDSLTLIGSLIKSKNVSAAAIDTSAPTKQIEETSQVVENEREFCRIKTELLVEASPLKAGIYIRLSETKFLKIFREGDVFDGADLERYGKQKQIHYFYLKSSETGEFINKFQASLKGFLAENPLDEKKVGQVLESVHETVQELITSLGVTPEIQGLVKTNMDIAVKAMGANPKLSQLLDRITKDQTKYISSHSVLLGQLSCTIAAAMAWKSESTYYKLNLAAFLHDIALKNNDLAAIQTLNELENHKGKFTDQELEDYLKHPSTAAELAKQFKEVPLDVDSIIAQHHELPDGTGFPRGLNHVRISPLSSIFIIAHELLIYIFKNDKDWKMEDFIKMTKEKYDFGNFKKVLKTLSEVKL